MQESVGTYVYITIPHRDSRVVIMHFAVEWSVQCAAVRGFSRNKNVARGSYCYIFCGWGVRGRSLPHPASARFDIITFIAPPCLLVPVKPPEL